MELGANAVKLVDEADTRHVVTVCLVPDRLGLRLDTGDTVEDSNCTVEYAKRALHLNGEVNVTGSIDDVDDVVVPLARGGGRRDGDSALLLLRHPVHRCGAFVHLTDLVVDPGVEEDPLSRRGFARVDMRHDPDVSELGEVNRGVCCHGERFSLSSSVRLPAVVREGLVGLGHLVGVFTTLDARAKTVACIEQLVHEALGHRLLATLA